MNKTWIKAALVRAIKTFAQAMAAVLSLFTSLAGLPEVQLSDTLYALDNDPDEEDELDENSEVWDGDE